MAMVQRWSPYFANPPFVVTTELRRAAVAGATGGLGMAGVGARFALEPPLELSDLVGLLAIACFSGVVLMAFGLWVSWSMSRRAARRVDQPLSVVWPSVVWPARHR